MIDYNMLKQNNIRQETDLPWKYILNLYFKAFMELCWPNRSQEINWARKPKFLDKELIKITKDAATGNKVYPSQFNFRVGKKCLSNQSI